MALQGVIHSFIKLCKLLHHDKAVVYKPWLPLNYFRPLSFCHFKGVIEMRTYSMQSFDIGFFTQHNSLEIHLCWVFQHVVHFHSCIVLHSMAGLEFVLCAHQSMEICDYRWNQVNSFMLSATCGYFMRLLISAFQYFFLNLPETLPEARVSIMEHFQRRLQWFTCI